DGEGPGPGAAVVRNDVERKRDTVVQPSVNSFELTPDGRKMLYATGGNWFIGSATGSGGGAPPAAAPAAAGPTRPRRGGGGAAPAAAPPGGEGGDQRLNLDAVEVRIDPRAEWRQIFEEAWRINRDFFYDPHMHGADWPAVRKKYAAFLPDLACRSDLDHVIRGLLSELAVGHSYTATGERAVERKPLPV